jgi:hypothetical protein
MAANGMDPPCSCPTQPHSWLTQVKKVFGILRKFARGTADALGSTNQSASTKRSASVAPAITNSGSRPYRADVRKLGALASMPSHRFGFARNLIDEVEPISRLKARRARLPAAVAVRAPAYLL